MSGHTHQAACPPFLSLFCRVAPLLALLLLSPGCVIFAKGHPSAKSPSAMIEAPAATAPSYTDGQLVLPDGSPADEEAFLDLARNATYILVGETHDNPRHHLAQARFLTAFSRTGRLPLLGLEMLPASAQKRLDAFNAGKIPLDSAGRELDWQNLWGFDFALYRPVFEAACAAHVPAYGLNVPLSVIQAIRAKDQNQGAELLRDGQLPRRALGLPPAQTAWLPKEILAPTEAQQEMLRAFFTRHGSMAGKGGPGPAPSPERFLLIQSLWDSAMAERAAQIRKNTGRPMLILAGGGHVEYGYGIAHRLRTFDPAAKILLVMPFSESKPDPDAADLFYYSKPRAQSRLGLALAEESGAVVVEAVAPGSPAEQAGIRPGDTLLRMGDTPVATLADLHKAAMAARRDNKPLSVELQRDGERRVVVLPERANASGGQRGAAPLDSPQGDASP